MELSGVLTAQCGQESVNNGVAGKQKENKWKMINWDSIQKSIRKSLGVDSSFKQEWMPKVSELTNGYYQIVLSHQTGIEVSLEEIDFEKGILMAIKRAKELQLEMKKGKTR